MGTLKPGAKYVYERTGDEVYAREFGEADRTLIGYTHIADTRTADGRPLHDHITESKMWGDIRRMAPTNPALQKALDRVIMIYRLSKDNPL